MTITKPSLVALFFFVDPETGGFHPAQQLAQNLNWQPSPQQPSTTVYEGIFQELARLSLAEQKTHDTLILQATATSLGEENDSHWKAISSAIDQITQRIGTEGKEQYPWAVSRLFYASVPAGVTGNALFDAVTPLFNENNVPTATKKPETTPFGWLWTLNDGFMQLSHTRKIWQRDLLLVIPDDRVQKVKQYFVDNLHQGFSRIELYLQKCKHLARQHESIQGELSRAITMLQQEMLEHLVTSDFSQIHTEPVLMEHMSRQLMRFLTQKAAVEILLNSLRSNLNLYTEHLERIKLDTPTYAIEKARVARQVEQIESDLHNASVIQDSAYAVQDIQRGAEASRFERASYLLGGTAALLAGISLFNSFLEIWSLALENSSWMMPAGWVRIFLSLLASISIPLAATWFISRKKLHALVSTLISLAAITAMVLTTILSNV